VGGWVVGQGVIMDCMGPGMSPGLAALLSGSKWGGGARRHTDQPRPACACIPPCRQATPAHLGSAPGSPDPCTPP
jgi:hypothetical protein